MHGQAEIFGAELAEGSTYLFGLECKAAVYTWQGCTIEMSVSECSAHNMLTLFNLLFFNLITSQAVLLQSTSPKRPL